MLIKTPNSAYVFLSILFSPMTLFGPLYIGYDKYFNAGFWQLHVLFLCLNVFTAFAMYRKVRIKNEVLTVSSFVFFGFRSKSINLNDVVSWKNENPIELVSTSRDVVHINWASFSLKDKEKLLNFLIDKNWVISK